MVDEVPNQPPPLVGHDLFAGDPVLAERFATPELGWASGLLGDLGRLLGSPETIALGEQANRCVPVLRSHDRYGRRIDEVEFHPAWHALMRLGMRHGVHNLPWNEPRPAAHAVRAVALFLLAQVEAGVTCPLSMTYAAVPTLRHEPELEREWLPRIRSCEYDERFVPAADKRGVLLGMSMTEKQGGSDLRANLTRARALAGEPGAYELDGHKWFCSAPMSDAFLSLAQTEAGLTCFLVPRFRPDGQRNRFRIQRLKDKLGNRSNASAEVEYDATWARRVGAAGRGIAAILEMVQHTRLDCIAGSAAQMRQALSQAAHHAAHRSAFGGPLAGQPLMANVLADLGLEVEAALLGLLRVARAFDGDVDPTERAFGRLATPVLKYWVCKRTPAVVAEALECLGGNGYVEESILPRLYREAPLMSIWEGSGNVICLDVLRAMRREPACIPAYFAELERACGLHPLYDAFVDRLARRLERPVEQAEARSVTQRLALALQAALLLGQGHPAAAEGFIRTRLGDAWLGTFGCLPGGIDVATLVERNTPGARAR